MSRTMTRKALTVLAVSLSIAMGTFIATARAESAKFQVRPHSTQTLKNGLKIVWIPDNALPYVGMLMMIKSGSSQDPIGKEGLAAFTAGMLEKGTKRRTALQISEDLEQIGSGFDVSVEPDYTMVASSSLSFHRDNSLKQFAEIVLKPSFPHVEIERYRKQLIGSLQKLSDRPQDFTEYLMPKFLFGAHPYGHESVGSPSSLRLLKKNDLQKFYAQNFIPSNAVMAIVGQYDEAWKASVAKTFEAWSGTATKVQELPEFPQWKGLELLLVDRHDLNQAQIQIGFKGIPRNIPEYLETRAALKILGESFGSRLFEEIREKRGLTYHISAWSDPRLKSGPMGIYTFTRVDKVTETLNETLKTYRLFVDKGVTGTEVDNVKELMKGQFPRMFETSEALARQILILDRYSVSTDYLANYLTNVEAMNTKRINETIKKYFNTENLRILVYAPKDKAEESLKPLGRLEVKNYKEYLQ